MTDCEKYKQFVEDNYMFEFIIWEQHILDNPLFNKNDGDGIIDIDSTSI